MTDDVARLILPDEGIVLDTWKKFSFHSDFLTPSDEFSFTLGHEDLPYKTRIALVPGQRVKLDVNGYVQGNGTIGDVTVGSGPGGGKEYNVVGGDVLDPAVYATADPRQQYSEGQTLLQFLQTVFGPFGFAGEDSFVIDDADNLNVMTGNKIRVSKKGKPLKQYLLHQLQPWPQEGLFEFASRVSQRHGLWIWPTADGTQLVVGKPSYDDSSSLFWLQRKGGDIKKVGNNVIDGTVTRSLRNQPSIIVAQGHGGGGQFPSSCLTVLVVNPAVIADNNDILQRYPDAIRIDMQVEYPEPIISKVARPLYLKDDQSFTQAHIENFAVREMSLRLRNAFHASYMVDGLTLNGIPWTVNTMVQVDDDDAVVYEPLWLKGRTFSQDRSGGTTTHIDLIRPGTLNFGGIVAKPSTQDGVAAPTGSDEDTLAPTGHQAIFSSLGDISGISKLEAEKIAGGGDQ